MSDLVFDIDWNNAAETVIQTGLDEVPVAGGILSGLVGIFWPSSEEDVWGSIKDRVSTMIDTKMASYAYTEIDAKLAGLKNLMDSYQSAISNGSSAAEIGEQWTNAESGFAQEYPSFKLSGYEYGLLPLFSKMATMYLILLRDGVLHGSDWGFTQAFINGTNGVNDKLTSRITEFTDYTRSTLTSTFPSGTGRIEKISSWVAKYNAAMAESATYYHYWQYLKNPTQNAVQDMLSPPQEYYLAVLGSGDSSNYYYADCFEKYDFNQRDEADKVKGLISQLKVWGRHDTNLDAIQGLQVSWPEETAPRMGPDIYKNHSFPFDDEMGKARLTAPYGGVIKLSGDNPIVQVQAHVGNVIDGISFKLKDESILGQYGGGTISSFVPANKDIDAENPFVLSSIIMNQGNDFVANGYGYDCSGLMLGFRRYKSYTEEERAYTIPPDTSISGTFLGNSSDLGNVCMQIFLNEGSSTDFDACFVTTDNNNVQHMYTGTYNPSSDFGSCSFIEVDPKDNPLQIAQGSYRNGSLSIMLTSGAEITLQKQDQRLPIGRFYGKFGSRTIAMTLKLRNNSEVWGYTYSTGNTGAMGSFSGGVFDQVKQSFSFYCGINGYPWVGTIKENHIEISILSLGWDFNIPGW